MGEALSRILIVLGSVGAWTGLIIFGMGTSELVPGAQMLGIGQLLMIGGVIALVVGIVMYRATREPDRSTF